MKPILLLTLLLTAACNREEKPQAPTAEQSDQLNEADDMLNGMANGEMPADQANDVSS